MVVVVVVGRRLDSKERVQHARRKDNKESMAAHIQGRRHIGESA